MPELTRDERIARQDGDDGDPDDTVYVAVGTRGAVTHYHDDADCLSLQQHAGELHERTRGAVQRAWKAPCGACVLGNGPHSGGDGA